MKRRSLKQLILLGLAGLIPVVLVAAEKVLLHTNESGIALDGYDPVAFFEEGKPVMGKIQHRVVFKGALYLFSSEANLSVFRDRPEKYEPKFGGYCPVALSSDHLAPGDPQEFRIVDGDLYLLHDAEAAEKFREDRRDQAERFWKRQLETNGILYEPASP
ncbi:MAG: YHS domain-containing protein [Verrucomicrobia bacterium]|jgi:YHS domain-containing protein|nr:YHS domain-containing protein [Verrucomicrobiota bacterium]